MCVCVYIYSGAAAECGSARAEWRSTRKLMGWGRGGCEARVERCTFLDAKRSCVACGARWCKGIFYEGILLRGYYGGF